MLLLYKENNKLTFCEYNGDYVVLIGADGKKHNEQISRYNQRYSNLGLTDGLGYRAIGFLSPDNKKHRIEDLLAVVISYRDLYDEPISEAMYNDMIGYNVPYEAEVVLAMDKTTNAFTFCTQREIDNPKARLNGLLTATRLYLPDGRLIVMDNSVIIHDLHYVNLNKYVNAKPYEDVKKVTLEVLRANLKGVSGTTTSKQGYLPKYKEKELSNIESVNVKKNFPNILEIEVKENYVSAYINTASGLTTIDNYGKVKEVATDNSKASGIQLKGIPGTGLKVGENFSDDEDKVKFLLDIITKEYYFDIVSIDFTNDSEIVLEFKNSFKVIFGDLKDYA